MFVSSEVAHTPEGRAPDGVAEQTAMILSHLSNTLKGEGLTLNDVLQVTVFLARPDDFALFNRVYQAHFTEPYPVRTTVLAGSLYPGACVEVQIIAAQTEGHQVRRLSAKLAQVHA